MVQDENREEIRARLSVVDGDGRSHAELRSLAALRGGSAPSPLDREVRVGPLPPGTYVVSATRGDGETASRRILLRGQEERSVKLRFKD